jgi:hypothetical protein
MDQEDQNDIYANYHHDNIFEKIFVEYHNKKDQSNKLQKELFPISERENRNKRIDIYSYGEYEIEK